MGYIAHPQPTLSLLPLFHSLTHPDLLPLNLTSISTMSDLTAKVSKAANGSITVEGYEALKYNFHYTSPVFDVQNKTLAEIYERWERVLIVIDTSESVRVACRSSC